MLKKLIGFLFLFIFFAILPANGVFANSALFNEHQNSIISSRDLINDIPYLNKDGTYNIVVEIPAGTLERWSVDKSNYKQLSLEFKNGAPKTKDFLPYPGNYGYLPQTKLSKKFGGDNAPLDILMLSQTVKRGSIQRVIIIGALKYLDKGEVDNKLIALSGSGPFKGVTKLSEIMIKYPGAIEIVKLWFDNYKKPGKMQFIGYMTATETHELIRKRHFYFESNRDE